MKKIFSALLSVMMIISITSSAFAAEDLTDDMPSPEVIEVEVPIAGTNVETPVIDLNSSSSAQTYDAATDLTTLSNTQPTIRNIDASSAIAIDLERSDTSPLDLPANQPPVADPEIFVLNPESMRDGQYTTATEFFIATRWNNVDLCYDPEGGPISFAFNSDVFPSGYITYVADPNGTFTGYLIKIFNKGSYPLLFAFADSYGGMSSTFSIGFDIIPRGVFESFEGELSSVTDEKDYLITVDYSKADKYYMTALRTGTGA